MGASLFLVVGPFNIGDLIGSGGGTTSAGKVCDEQAERIEKKLRREPDRRGAAARPDAGADLGRRTPRPKTNPETGPALSRPKAAASLERGLEAWSRYLKQSCRNRSRRSRCWSLAATSSSPNRRPEG